MVIEHGTPVTAVCFDHTGQRVFFGGVDNQIHAYNLRADDYEYALQGPTDTITGLQLSPDGDRLLSNSMDSSVILNQNDDIEE